MQSEPLDARTQVWALPVSLAATPGIDVSFSSSVIHTPIHNVWKGTRGTETSKYPEEKKENSIP